ncbi:transglycosylase SLT domain-containing protein [Stenotrophomonas sp. CFBP8994]|uniref:transglycosylase SLT domain-containing protein n=1 Tax=Stenotrophomonas sp. CFBP8994 TaxID=3096527 RepID=UPI002A6B5EA3|nr:transglycosylase SLT domain-containing protein [Stenotrophomonas sp. CFBP8994]MDY0980013.1 transglycosylase SLT domain-containing protein [Stenotrophomonas sp. CFBP8994]
MNRLPLLILSSATLLACTGVGADAGAQSLDIQRAQMKAAIENAERGQFDPGQAAGLAKHPLYGWLEYANLRRNIDTVTTAQAQDFLKRYNGQAVASSFRSVWLPAVARRQDWPTLLANWAPTENVGLRCAQLNARQATGKADAQWVSEAQAIWRSTGKSLPDACDPVFAVLDAKGGMSAELRWERIDAAADAQEPAVMRSAARGLPAADLALANTYAAFVDKPNASALNWPRNERSRRIATDGLAKLAKADPDATEQQLPQYASALQLSAAQQADVKYQIALWTVASYGPDSARRLNAVPDSAYDERLHEWRAREAMSRGDWPATLAAIRKMEPKQRSDSRWRYFEARMLDKTGKRNEALPLYREAARAATFHGFLAADQLGQSTYTLCPVEPKDSAQAQATVARDPAIVRAMELFKIERSGWAVAEWNDALTRFDTTQRRIAVEVARDSGWFDRAVFSLGKTPEEQRLYSLRFPLHHDDAIRRESARNAIDPAWVAAEIRAESIFNPKARSPANAMGLMQVLPATGASVAKTIGLTNYGGAASLYDADTNIAIGTAYLRQLMNKYEGLPYVTIAAYNAGPTPTARWQSQRPGFDPDIWIETISYKETREYVARILAFSVIYDWRLNGDALPVTDRMNGRLQAKRKAFACPTDADKGGD